MKTSFTANALFSLVLVAGCRAQIANGGIAGSHIDGNVPPSPKFDAFMKRDLASYLCRGAEDCRIEYQLLREGPTQTGIAYPKFYVWAICSQGNKVLTQGAARVAAIDKESFRVTDFLSREEILESPQQIGSIFPASLISKIVQHAR